MTHKECIQGIIKDVCIKRQIIISSDLKRELVDALSEYMAKELIKVRIKELNKLKHEKHYFDRTRQMPMHIVIDSRIAKLQQELKQER